MATITPLEKRTITALAGIFALRMLGLFMILPVFSIYAVQLDYSTPTLIGIALGIYGLTQALLQIPFGFASDRLGRKPMIVLGLLLFAAGSSIAACSHSIYGVIIGRSLQGASAIGCVIMALVADLTREEVRVRAMAFIGITIGLSFALAMVLGPFLNTIGGVRGIFWITAVFSLFAIPILLIFVPTPTSTFFQPEASPILALIPKVLMHSELGAFNIGVLILHASLIALFLKLPAAIKEMGFGADDTWQFYLPVLLGSLFAAGPCLLIMEKKCCVKHGLTAAIFSLAIAELGIGYFFNGGKGLMLSVGLFFTAFNILEASLPSLVSRVAPKGSKGTALGLYSAAQFLGLFLGGVLGGWLDTNYDMVGIVLFCFILTVIWLMLDFTVNFKRSLPWQEG